MLFVAFTFFAIIGSCVSLPSDRILNGENAEVAQFPSTVSVRVNNVHVGVGNIIDEKYILTAAHIVTKQSPASISVRVGSTNIFAGGRIVQVAAVHEQSSFGNFLHDITILELADRLTFDEKVQHIEIATEDDLEEGTQVRVAGWGLTNTGEQSYKLQYADMAVLSPSTCEYEAGFGYPSVICLHHEENQGICKGDEGAGVVVNNKLYGIASFAFGRCGTRFPDVAARVPFYRDWISSIINSDK